MPHFSTPWRPFLAVFSKTGQKVPKNQVKKSDFLWFLGIFWILYTWGRSKKVTKNLIFEIFWLFWQNDPSMWDFEKGTFSNRKNVKKWQKTHFLTLQIWVRKMTFSQNPLRSKKCEKKKFTKFLFFGKSKIDETFLHTFVLKTHFYVFLTSPKTLFTKMTPPPGAPRSKFFNFCGYLVGVDPLRRNLSFSFSFSLFLFLFLWRSKEK